MKLFRKTILIVLITSLFSTIPTNTANAITNENNAVLEDKLQEIGIDSEYRENIIDYINSLLLNKSQLQEIQANSEELLQKFNDILTNTDLSLSGIYSIYDDIEAIEKALNLNIDLNPLTQNIKITDKDTKNLLLNANSSELYTYYSNFKANLESNADLAVLSNLLNPTTQDSNSPESEIGNLIEEYTPSPNNNPVSNTKEAEAETTPNSKELTSQQPAEALSPSNITAINKDLATSPWYLSSSNITLFLGGTLLILSALLLLKIRRFFY